jgi:DNA-binding NarL/FixJ family response regulator
MIRVLLVQRIRLTLELLGAALEGEPDLTVVGMVTETKDALAALETTACDLVLIGAHLPNNAALELVQTIRRQALEVHVLVMGLPENPAVILPYIEAGASGFVLGSSSVPELLHNIRACAQNQALVTPEMAALLIDKVAQLSQKLSELSIDLADYHQLTEREKEVLDLIAAGCTNQEIAETLTIEMGTVKNHVHNILSKLNVHSRQDAAVYLSLLDDQHDAPNPSG